MNIWFLSFYASYFTRGKKQPVFKKLLYFNLIMDNIQLEFDSNNHKFDATSLIEEPCNSEFSLLKMMP